MTIICSLAMRDRILHAYGRCGHGPSAERCEPVSSPKTIVFDGCTFVLDENVPRDVGTYGLNLHKGVMRAAREDDDCV